MRQWNLSPPTIDPLSSGTNICHVITARAASQRSRRKRSNLSAKGQKIGTKNRYPNSHVQGAPSATGCSPARPPPSDPFEQNPIRRPL